MGFYPGPSQVRRLRQYHEPDQRGGGFRLGYTGRPRDLATGLSDNWHRWYDAAVGRFLSEDPAAADLNLFRYAGNNPMTNTDPTGLDWTGVAGSEPSLSG
jgi:RHS repeat-associated protein